MQEKKFKHNYIQNIKNFLILFMKGTRLNHKVVPILVLNILKVMEVLFLFIVIWGPSSNNLLISIWPTTQGTFSCTFQNIYHGWNVNNHGWISSIIKFKILGLTWNLTFWARFKSSNVVQIEWFKNHWKIFQKWLINWVYKVIVN
jgi:hypothetical protein